MDIQNVQVLHAPLTLTVTDPVTGVKSIVPIPVGDVFTPVSSSPSMGAVVVDDGTGNLELVVSPLVIESDAANGGGNISITVSDSLGDIQTGIAGLNIVTVPVVRTITLGSPTFTAQPAPTAPGP